MSKPSLTNCPKLAAAPAARGVPAQSWYNERYMKIRCAVAAEAAAIVACTKVFASSDCVVQTIFWWL